MDWRHMHELLSAAHSLYNEMKNLCVWTKTNAGMGSLYPIYDDPGFRTTLPYLPPAGASQAQKAKTDLSSAWHCLDRMRIGKNANARPGSGGVSLRHEGRIMGSLGAWFALD